MLKDVALNTGVFAGAVVGVAVGSAGGFTGAEGVVGAGFAGAFLLLTVTKKSADPVTSFEYSYIVTSSV